LTAGLPLALIAVLAAIALLHAYWGVGGLWPGRDEASLAQTVIGRIPGGKMPPPAACMAVAAAIAAGVALVALVSFTALPEPQRGLARIAYGVFASVFLLRGLAGYVPPIWKPSAGTPFVRLNIRYYSPLCLIIGAGLTINALWR